MFLAVQCERKPLVLTNGDYKQEESNGIVSDDDNSMESGSQTEEKNSEERKEMQNVQSGVRATDNSNSEHCDSPSVTENGPIRPQASHAFEAYNRNYIGENILAGVLPFTVDPPSISVTEPGYLYELSTRLLFASVDWVKGLLCFSRLCEEDKVRLLLEKWYLLFALGLLQCSHMFPVSTLLTMAGNEHSSGLKWQTFLKLKGVIMNGGMLGRVSKDIHEYMKIVTLFDQGKGDKISPDKKTIFHFVSEAGLKARLHDHTLVHGLHKFVGIDLNRCSKMLNVWTERTTNLKTAIQMYDDVREQMHDRVDGPKCSST